ncbi:DNA mismatch repair endonuclease MutL [Marinicrinis sediminis]|uniref:DNA mismatch repair protein MutL n=1 Tax=Marinicrinis sediminis TaxID=1652465 RepID=A0ABW5RE36_9BACL
MGIIRILDDHIANQIAAGEVVERPASVVKELVENAIDAQSRKIEVSIEEGGLEYIRVKDNGTGMDADDCEKAFQRHATSKIVHGRDLFQIRTLGFRGEALPSIAAVSKLELVTSDNKEGLGRKLVMEGGKLLSAEDTRAGQGTDMKIRGLFFNTPARLKYMKTVQTELGHVTDYMYRLALAKPDISFVLQHNGKTLLQTQGNGDLLQVIASIYGPSAARQMLKLEGDHPDYVLSGYTAVPEFTRASRSALTTIINGRYIRSFSLMQAIMRAYHTLLPVHRYPLSVLHVHMDPSLIDVNVHPAKLEVRFSKEQELLRFVEEQVKGMLQEQVLIPKPMKSGSVTTYMQNQIDFVPAPAPRVEEAGPKSEEDTDAKSIDSFIAGDEFTGDERRGQPEEGEETPSRTKMASRLPTSSTQTSGQSGSSYGQQRRKDEGTVNPEAVKKWLDSSSDSSTPSASTDASSTSSALPKFSKLYPIGQVKGTYILAQNEEGLYIIDQHAAHERIHYEYYVERFASPPSGSQELLLPITLELTALEADVVERHLAELEQIGVYLESFGKQTYKVTAYPHWLPDGEQKEWIEEMIQWVIDQDRKLDIGKLREKAAIMCSCKASIKANQKQTYAEMDVLLERLRACRTPYTCPHGRPIMVSFSNYDLEKMFKRVM